MKVKIDQQLFQKLPQYKVGVLIARNLGKEIDRDGSYQYLDQETEEIRKEGIDLLRSDKFKEWIDAFEEVGANPKEISPAHISLTERVIGGNDIPNINHIVNSCNAVSLRRFLPVGAHALNQIDGDVTIGYTPSEMEFINRDGSITSIPANSPTYHDDRSVITKGFIGRQSQKTLVTDDTTDIFIPIDLIGGESTDQIEEIAKEIAAALLRFSGSGDFTFGVIDSNNLEIVVDQLLTLSTLNPLNFNTAKISRDRDLIDRILTKGVEDIIPSREVLEEALLSGKRLRIYQGYDPTADTLHIGHTVMMRKLEDFRQLGHEVIMLIGDFTARIGDPTDKSSARVQLSEKEVKENLKLYQEQASSILNFDDPENPVQVKFNNDWLGKMNFSDVIDLCSEFTVQQMLKRDMFQQRLADDKPIYINEFLYPLMQGWDSVVMGIDIELGGNDQLFNMLAGRELVQKKLHKQKFVITGKLLTTNEGAKMGKSEGNMIKLSDSAQDIYGKVMAFSDNAIVTGFELLTNVDMEKVRSIESALLSGKNPIELKKELAYTITSELKGESAAEQAEKYFEEVFQKGSYEVELEEVVVKEETLPLLQLLSEYVAPNESKSSLRRLIEQGAVSINDQKLSKWDESITVEDNSILRLGKRVVRLMLLN